MSSSGIKSVIFCAWRIKSGEEVQNGFGFKWLVDRIETRSGFEFDRNCKMWLEPLQINVALQTMLYWFSKCAVVCTVFNKILQWRRQQCRPSHSPRKYSHSRPIVVRRAVLWRATSLETRLPLGPIRGINCTAILFCDWFTPIRLHRSPNPPPCRSPTMSCLAIVGKLAFNWRLILWSLEGWSDALRCRSMFAIVSTVTID